MADHFRLRGHAPVVVAPSGNTHRGAFGHEIRVVTVPSVSVPGYGGLVGDGPCRRALERLLPEAVFTGRHVGNDLEAALASLDLLVHPGADETFCHVVQESLCGRARRRPTGCWGTTGG